MKASVIATFVGAAVVAATDCPAVGATDSQGRYSCNPAHQYPNGQTCKPIDNCNYLVGADGKPVPNAPATTTSVAAAASSAACPAAGASDSKGRYSCNPAHQYPSGQTCALIDGCYFLTSCPAAGSADSQGRYSCNPAHQYPNGQSCKVIDGCYFLVGTDGKPVPNAPATTSAAAAAASSTACPAAGSTDSHGRYSCNPAHQYPNGQSCKVIDNCYYLVGTDGKPVPNAPATTVAPAAAGATCLPAGSTDSKGRYSCNPAHQYPNGQTCALVEGCYYLSAGGKPINNASNTTAPAAHPAGPSATAARPTVTAGAASLQAAGALAVAVFGLLL